MFLWKPIGSLGGGYMTIEGRSPVASRVATDWQARLRELQSAILQDPRNEHAWQWQIQAKVLAFFLSRYGNRPALTWEEDLPSFAIPPPRFPVHQLIPPPAPVRIRELLERIADANRHRRN